MEMDIPATVDPDKHRRTLAVLRFLEKVLRNNYVKEQAVFRRSRSSGRDD